MRFSRQNPYKNYFFMIITHILGIELLSFHLVSKMKLLSKILQNFSKIPPNYQQLIYLFLHHHIILKIAYSVHALVELLFNYFLPVISKMQYIDFQHLLHSVFLIKLFALPIINFVLLSSYIFYQLKQPVQAFHIFDHLVQYNSYKHFFQTSISSQSSIHILLY